MAKKSHKLNRSRRNTARQCGPQQPRETRAAETITVAWTVTVTTVLLCNFIVVGANVYAWQFPAAKLVRFVESFVLFSASVFGIVAIALVPVVIRVRSVPPPHGFVVFAIFVAIAPILAIIVRLSL